MPELPEVEVIRRGLLPHVTDKEIVDVTFSGKKLRKEIDECAVRSALSHYSIETIERRAKFLLFHITSGHIFLLHLGMTGNLGIFEKDQPLRKHDHIIFHFADCSQMRFYDPRRFGYAELFSPPDASRLEEVAFSNYGPEPFHPECNGTSLYERAKKKTQPVKNFLMDNRNIVGVGNIYANETLFISGIRPSKRCNRISKKQWDTIYKNLVKTLEWAISCGGSTISDFLQVSGVSGYFQANFKVYGKRMRLVHNADRLLKSVFLGGGLVFIVLVVRNRLSFWVERLLAPSVLHSILPRFNNRLMASFLVKQVIKINQKVHIELIQCYRETML